MEERDEMLMTGRSDSSWSVSGCWVEAGWEEGEEEGEWSEGEVGTEMLEASHVPRTHHTPRTRTEVALVCSWMEELSPRAF